MRTCNEAQDDVNRFIMSLLVQCGLECQKVTGFAGDKRQTRDTRRILSRNHHRSKYVLNIYRAYICASKQIDGNRLVSRLEQRARESRETRKEGDNTRRKNGIRYYYMPTCCIGSNGVIMLKMFHLSFKKLFYTNSLQLLLSKDISHQSSIPAPI